MKRNARPLLDIAFRRLARILVAVMLTWLSIDAQAQGTSSVARGSGTGSGTEYKTAWPKQVPVLRPDPVLGEAKVWEHWTYDKTFAERFFGFDSAKATTELNPGVHAIVFRTYKEKIFDQVPDLFVCEYEVYFDNRISIPLSEREAVYRYPSGISHSFRGLQPSRQEDARFLAEARSVGKAPKSWPLIFADGKLDGRYAKLAMAYFPNLVPGISMVALGKGDFTCKVIGPKRADTRHWIWLFGELSYNKEGSSFIHMYSERFKKWMNGGTFDPGPLEQTLANGHVRLPEAFYEAVLSKVTLVKAVNQCITWRNGYEVGRVRDISGGKAQLLRACDEVEREGVIYEQSYDGLLKGWHHFGF